MDEQAEAPAPVPAEDVPGKATIARVMAMPGFPLHHGFETLSVEAGLVTLAVNARPDLMQFRHNFHTGTIAALADQAAAAAALTVLPPGQVPVTVELKLNNHRTATGRRLYATARVVSSGGGMVIAEVRIEAESMAGRGPCGGGIATMRAMPMIL